MTDAVIATRTQIAIGSLVVDEFMPPDGSYQMSQKNVANAVGKPAMNASRFLGSKAIKGFLGEGYTDNTLEQIAVETGEGKRGQTRINALPLNDEAIARLTNRIDQLTVKQDRNQNLLNEVLRVMGNLGERSYRNESGVEALHDAVGRLTRAAQADRAEMRNVTGRLGLPDVSVGFSGGLFDASAIG